MDPNGDNIPQGSQGESVFVIQGNTGVPNATISEYRKGILKRDGTRSNRNAASIEKYCDDFGNEVIRHKSIVTCMQAEKGHMEPSDTPVLTRNVVSSITSTFIILFYILLMFLSVDVNIMYSSQAKELQATSIEQSPEGLFSQSLLNVELSSENDDIDECKATLIRHSCKTMPIPVNDFELPQVPQVPPEILGADQKGGESSDSVSIKAIERFFMVQREKFQHNVQQIVQNTDYAMGGDPRTDFRFPRNWGGKEAPTPRLPSVVMKRVQEVRKVFWSFLFLLAYIV